MQWTGMGKRRKERSQNMRQCIQPDNVMALEDELTQKVLSEFERATLEYTTYDPEKRPRIPKLKPSWKIWKALKILNSLIIPRKISECKNLAELVDIVYCAAVTTVRMDGREIADNNVNCNKKTSKNKPAWQHRLEKQVEEIRVKLGRLIQYQKGNRAKRLVNKIIIKF